MYESEEEEEGVNLDVVRRKEHSREEIQVYSTWILPLREQMATQTKIQERKKKKKNLAALRIQNP
jgi:hypothetical protein